MVLIFDLKVVNLRVLIFANKKILHDSERGHVESHSGALFQSLLVDRATATNHVAGAIRGLEEFTDEIMLLKSKETYLDNELFLG